MQVFFAFFFLCVIVPLFGQQLPLSFCGSYYPDPIGHSLQYLEDMGLELRDVTFDQVSYFMEFERMRAKFYMTGSVLDSCVFEGDDRYIRTFFFTYWPETQREDLLKADEAVIYYFNDQVIYRRMPKGQGRIGIYPVGV